MITIFHWLSALLVQIPQSVTDGMSVEYRACGPIIRIKQSPKSSPRFGPGRFGYHIRVISVLLEAGKRNKLDLGR
jgi:hypothetical protein